MRSSIVLLALVAICALLVSGAVPTPAPPTPSGGSSVTPAIPIDVRSFGPGPVVLITAHPDDIEGAAGGLVATLVAAEVEIYYVIITNGDKGCGNPALCPSNITSEEIALIRSKEAINAAAVLKVPADNVFLLDYEDAMLTSYPEQQVRMQLVTILRAIRPRATVVWAPYPNVAMRPSEGWDDLGYHPDHQASGRLGIDATFDSGVGLLWPEMGDEWPIGQLYMFDFGMGTIPPTHYLDIESVLTLKIDSYLAHATQVPSDQGMSEWLTDLAEMVANCSAIQAGEGKGVKYAEAYVAYF
jgi:LmbE family N-acetylglucosaminyl deacetylase